jgi:hypothetical protein
MEWFSTSSGRIELQISLDDARSASHQGACDEEVAVLANEPYIVEQLAKFSPELIRDELRGYGTWGDEELADDAQNIQRLIWIAAGDIIEESFL